MEEKGISLISKEISERMKSITELTEKIKEFIIDELNKTDNQANLTPLGHGCFTISSKDLFNSSSWSVKSLISKPACDIIISEIKNKDLPMIILYFKHILTLGYVSDWQKEKIRLNQKVRDKLNDLIEKIEV